MGIVQVRSREKIRTQVSWSRSLPSSLSSAVKMGSAFLVRIQGGGGCENRLVKLGHCVCMPGTAQKPTCLPPFFQLTLCILPPLPSPHFPSFLQASCWNVLARTPG